MPTPWVITVAAAQLIIGILLGVLATKHLQRRRILETPGVQLLITKNNTPISDADGLLPVEHHIRLPAGIHEQLGCITDRTGCTYTDTFSQAITALHVLIEETLDKKPIPVKVTIETGPSATGRTP